MNINNVKFTNDLVSNSNNHVNSKSVDFFNAIFPDQKLKIVLSTAHLEELLYRDKFILELSQDLGSQDVEIIIEKEKSF
jgi:hypothetical protein